MSKELTFYFDFSSAYSYIAQKTVEEAFANTGVTVKWQPILLGIIFRENGWSPVTPDTPKGKYTFCDVARYARAEKLVFKLPKVFPYNSMLAARVFYTLPEATAVLFAKAIFHAVFAEGQDAASQEVIGKLLQKLNVDAANILEKSGSDEIKAAVRSATAIALEKGVFGAPTFAIGDELFWGADRLEHAKRWCETGGW
ncbi:2-hydroxychromene-2-carboxylate isomerase [Kordiimonas pumila]|uniref:2-hydroxychromene-2-carboxylate isomerase n=1 Tax=Kordiimonas pumila TaxID=2161677 RepID=A0ABV7D6T4_9PROT|nr:2-hydroxychromene-2-carboxylate isomerase [Kordiimonas pumila]